MLTQGYIFCQRGSKSSRGSRDAQRYMLVSALMPAAPIGRRLQLLSLQIFEHVQNPLTHKSHIGELWAQPRAKLRIPLLASPV